MPIFTDAASAEVRRNAKTLYGKIMTRPLLMVSDGINAVFGADVNIGPTDPTGLINQYNKQKKDGNVDGDFGEYRANYLVGLPGQAPEWWNLEDSLPGHVNTVMHNVPIARGNADLIYAEVGNAVRLDRDAVGQWHITGFSQEMPGTHTLVPVDLGDMTIGTVLDLSIDTALLTLAEIGELKPFGIIPFGASAIYIGGILERIV
jgi:hypothetical protein